LNASAYYFTFPISLRREAFSLKYDAYQFGSFVSSTKVNAAAYTASMTLDTLWFNKLLLPIEFVYIYSRDTAVAEKQSFQINLGVTF
jgi:ethanolamine utilization protein EutA (predicted chaperonin)